MEEEKESWKDLCAKIAVEQDSEKLTKLLDQMLRLLDAERRSKEVDRANNTSSDDAD